MSQKEHGTSHTPVQSPLRWGCDEKVADRICNFNRHYAEYSGYWERTAFMQAASLAAESGSKITFYDSNTGKPLFYAPVIRSWKDFMEESRNHGWPSFRDDEVESRDKTVVWNTENLTCFIGIKSIHNENTKVSM